LADTPQEFSVPVTARGPKTPSKGEKPARALTLETFRLKYSNREDGYKYEFKKGEIIKSRSHMNVRQYSIIRNISRRFAQTKAWHNGDELCVELEQITLPEQMRKPDISYMTAERLGGSDESVSPFVIEIVSPTDKAQDVEDKRLEYFEAGVKVVWQIYPKTKSVHIYTAPTDVRICTGDRVCDATPVLPDFEITAQEVFG
jgi:Uma2 family endonuclease